MIAVSALMVLRLARRQLGEQLGELPLDNFAQLVAHGVDAIEAFKVAAQRVAMAHRYAAL